MNEFNKFFPPIFSTFDIESLQRIFHVLPYVKRIKIAKKIYSVFGIDIFIAFRGKNISFSAVNGNWISAINYGIVFSDSRMNVPFYLLTLETILPEMIFMT